ncbi:short-chain dehydrogenase [Anopheles sinensis]|uniref:Short-chain dehydrogenase n=1 Tax=Anopheles sinensis TaxID=74873 RepID=A0A084WUA4_ANOSI|nr:short-chain dehydrogenase [Anopheles sinensis]
MVFSRTQCPVETVRGWYYHFSIQQDKRIKSDRPTADQPKREKESFPTWWPGPWVVCVLRHFVVSSPHFRAHFSESLGEEGKKNSPPTTVTCMQTQ